LFFDLKMGDKSIVDPDSELKIVTWNINGLRSFDNFPDLLRSFNADILCFQETKVTRDQLPQPLAIIPGYSSYYTFTRNGSGAYSGVATYVRNTCTPVNAEEGITGYLNQSKDGGNEGTKLLNEEFAQDELKLLDYEGRCVITKHKVKHSSDKYLYVINLYCPRADPEREDRKVYKLEFYKAVDIRANSLADEGNYVIVLGDINTSHREIDHCDPYEDFHDHPGRRFLDHFLDQGDGLNKESNSSDKVENNSLRGQDDEVDDGSVTEDAWRCARVNINHNQFYDTFRIFHRCRKEAFTCWNTKLNCRSTNYGTRIDYIFISKQMKDLASYCDINTDILGSDHCPVTARFQLEIEASAKIPSTATKYFPEFQGRQLSIKDMMQNATNSTANFQSAIKRSSTNSQPAAKKVKPAKITNFFAPKNVVESKQDVNINVISDIAKSEVNLDSDMKDVALKTTTNNYGAKSTATKEAWSKLFQAPAPAPLCSGHQDQCVKRKVTKKGPNQGREFYCCPRGEGRADDPKARCNFFKWAKSR